MKKLILLLAFVGITANAKSAGTGAGCEFSCKDGTRLKIMTGEGSCFSWDMDKKCQGHGGIGTPNNLKWL